MIATTDSVIFYKGTVDPMTLQVGSFHFNLTAGGNYIKHNISSPEGISLPFVVVPIDTSINCVSDSKLNFVHLISGHYNLLSCRKFSVVVFLTTTLLCRLFRHHGPESDGWQSKLICDPCLGQFKQMQVNYSCCHLLEDCT
jgi:hypothetical protein